MNRRRPMMRALAEGRVWFVAFSDSEILPSWRTALAGRKVRGERIQDYNGRSVLAVLHPLADEKH